MEMTRDLSYADRPGHTVSPPPQQLQQKGTNVNCIDKWILLSTGMFLEKRKMTINWIKTHKKWSSLLINLGQC